MSIESTIQDNHVVSDLDRQLHERMLTLINTYEDELRDAVTLVHGRIENLNRLRHQATLIGQSPATTMVFSRAIDDLVDQVGGLERRVVTSLRALEFANRRKEPRVPVDIEASLACGNGVWPCRIENLSAGGAQVYVTDPAAKAGDAVRLSLDRIGTVAGKVVATRPDILHVQFHTPNPDVMHQIGRTLEYFSTKDRPVIAALKDPAVRIGQVFEAAAERGEISLEDLFDDDYEPVAGTDPKQYLTRFTALADRLLPAIQEAMLAVDHRVVFCVAVDRNGYLPTHNHIYSQPQRPDDPVWNTAHCRNRRVFDDSTGIAAARNREPLLIQTYRRDMGGGATILMKDVSAPVFVQGSHWGGLRVGCRILD